MDELLNVLVDAAVLVVPVVLALALVVLKRYLAVLEGKAIAEIGEHKVYLLEEFARNFVMAAAQTVGLGTNAERKAYAFKLLRNLADSLAYPVNDEQLDALIEAVFRELKQAGKVD